PHRLRRLPEERKDTLAGASSADRVPLPLHPGDEPAVAEPRPHPSLRIGGEGLDALPLDQGEADPVEAHQAGAGPEPQVAVRALRDGADRSLRQPLDRAPGMEFVVLQRARRIECPGRAREDSTEDQAPKKVKTHRIKNV